MGPVNLLFFKFLCDRECLFGLPHRMNLHLEKRSKWPHVRKSTGDIVVVEDSAFQEDLLSVMVFAKSLVSN